MLEFQIAVDNDLTAYTAEIDTMARDAIGDYYAGLSIGAGVVRLHLEDGYGEPIPVYDDGGLLLYYTINPDDNMLAVIEAIQAFTPQ